MGRPLPSLVRRLLRAVDSDRFVVPTYWSVLARYPTAELSLKQPAAPQIRYSDASLYQQLYHEHPQVRLQAMQVNATQPALARRYVDQQQAAMAGGASEQEAAAAAAQALGGQLSSPGEQRGGLVGSVQAAEEEVLMEAFAAALGGQQQQGGTAAQR